jgi:hypothetical protein
VSPCRARIGEAKPGEDEGDADPGEDDDLMDEFEGHGISFGMVWVIDISSVGTLIGIADAWDSESHMERKIMPPKRSR